MMIPCSFHFDRNLEFFRFAKLGEAKAWLFARMAALDWASGDLRWAILDAGLRALSRTPSLLTERWQQRASTLWHRFGK